MRSLVAERSIRLRGPAAAAALSARSAPTCLRLRSGPAERGGSRRGASRGAASARRGRRAASRAAGDAAGAARRPARRRRRLGLGLGALEDRRVEIGARLARQPRPELVAQHAGARLHDFALGEIAEFERPEGDADQPVDRQAEVLEHALDLAVLALAQAHRQPDVRALRALEPRLDAGVMDALDA